MREYIVTCKTKEELQSFYDDMETPGGNLYIPDREVELTQRRPISRNTHYMLSDEEAEQISNDDRVISVELTPEEKGAEVKPCYLIESSSDAEENPEGREDFSSSYTLTTNYWSKSQYNNNQFRQWGMYRMRNQATVNNWGQNGQQSIQGTVQFTSTGKYVDVVIVDGCIDPAHPEMQANENGTGGTRVNQFNWFSLNPEVTGGSQGTYLYTNSGNGDYTLGGQQEDDNNHGMHVAGTACGNRLGWARESTVYNINPYPSAPSGISLTLLIDYIRAFHNSKSVNTQTGFRNPTVTNHSYGVFYDINVSDVSSATYRGTTYSNPNSATLNNIGVVNNGTLIDNMPNLSNAIQADIDDAVADGILFIGAAGNSDFKIDVQGGIDYDNTITYSGNTEYYHRGATPTALNGMICVGAIDSTIAEQKANFSNSGPRVDCYSPGVQILSSVLSGGVTDSRNNSYRLQKYPGTSMASPNVAGVVACLLEHWPRMNQYELQTYMSASGANSHSNNHLCTIDDIVNGGGNQVSVTVSASGFSDYTLSGDVTGSDPAINVTEGDVITFNLSCGGHPFVLKYNASGGTYTGDSGDDNYLGGFSSGSYPSTLGTFNCYWEDATGNNKVYDIAMMGNTSGKLIWNTTGMTPGTYHYQCRAHSNMHGEINIAADTSNRSLHGGNNYYIRMPKVRKVPNPTGTTYVGAETTSQISFPRGDTKFRPILSFAYDNGRPNTEDIVGGDIDEDVYGQSKMIYPRHPIWNRNLT